MDILAAYAGICADAGADMHDIGYVGYIYIYMVLYIYMGSIGCQHISIYIVGYMYIYILYHIYIWYIYHHGDISI